jgi:hypothetical protein
MRNAMPMQWIEQAEARQVLTAALFERTPRAPRRDAAGDAAPLWLARMRSWLAPGYPMAGPLLEGQPALIRGPAGCSKALSQC